MAMRDLTRGPVRGHLLRMSGFMLLTMLVQTLYGLIDIYWVGRIGRDAVAAVSLGSNLMMLVMAVGQVLAVGAAAVVAQAAGRRDSEALRSTATQAQLLAGMLAAGFVLVCYALRGTFSKHLAGSPETARLTAEFLGPFIAAMGLQIPMFVLSALLRGVGDVRTAGMVQIGTVLLNLILAPWLIFGGFGLPPLGVAGAALASLLAIGAGLVVLSIRVIRAGQIFVPLGLGWRPRPALWRRIAVIGLPSGAEFALMALYFGFIMAMLQRFGSAEQAGFGIGMRVLHLGMMPAMAVCFTTAAIVGQNLGAGLAPRIREGLREALRLNLATTGLFCVLFHLAPEALVGLFSPDPAVIAAGAEFLRMISWNLVTTGIVMACAGVFSGLGNTLPTLMASGLRIGFIVGLAALLSSWPGFAPRWLWWLSIAGALPQLLLCLVFLRQQLRQRVDGLQPVGAAGAVPA